MDDPAEARRLVEEIRSGLARETGLTADLLRVVSDEIYSNPTHFLFELLQNADDNSYGDDEPRLSLVYRTSGYLWIGCNEKGFTEANLRALCSACRSTKKVAGNRKGYIGEKGLGFKATFKVADSIWVKSGALSFNFDRNMDMGIVTPIWCDFPTNPAIEERTMFCFRIPDKAHQNMVQSDVESLEAELLLFLRQLRKIHITVQAENGRELDRHFLLREDDLRSEFRVTELSHQQHPNQEAISQKFVVCTHTTREMPHHEKRGGIEESDLLLAFPVDGELQPVVASQRVYNFLPIRSYGFPFILQADFILVANREDVEQGNSWNAALVSAARDAFVASVGMFTDDEMGYTWPRYLSLQPQAQGTIFAGFHSSLLQQLRLQPVLKSALETKQRPVDLQCVRADLADATGKPLFAGAGGMSSFAHHGYRPADLSALGVRQQSSDEFISLLQDYMKRQPTKFQEQPAEWHSRLSAALVLIDSDKVRGLNLIPLRSGRWVSARSKQSYFPDLDEGTLLPQGIEVEIVADDAARDGDRRKLYDQLGVSALTEAKVFDLILQQHGRQSPAKCSWPVDIVVDHAWFLFRSKSYPRDYVLEKLLVASRHGKLHSGKDLYMDIPNATFKLSHYLDGTTPGVQYLNKAYYDIPDTQILDDPNGAESLRLKWLTWLHNAIGVRTVPRLIAAGGIAPEFDAIIRRSNGNEWLQLLKDEWNTYAIDLQGAGNEKVKDLLKSCEVLCKGGLRRPLSSAYLSTKRVLSEPFATSAVPMIDVKDPDHEDWRKLGRTLQMHATCDSRLYITILERMRDGLCAFALEDVKRMYSGIAEHFTSQAALDLRTKPLVFIATPRPSKWVPLSSCRWESPASIFTLYALRERYKDKAELFRHKLHLPDATAQDVVGELTKLDGRIESINEIRSLLKLLASFVAEGKIDRNSFPGLTRNSVKILPVRRGEELALQAFFGDDWFLAENNKAMLNEAFEGQVFFPDVDLSPNSSMRKLFENLGLLAQGLEYKVHSHLQFPEDGSQWTEKTEQVQAKAEYLARIAEAPERERAMSLLSRVQVWVSGAINQKRYVSVRGKRIYGSDVKRYGAVQSRPSYLQIWIEKGEKDQGTMPSEFYGELMDALGIPKRNKELVSAIFETDISARIEQKLEDAGYGQRFVPDASSAATTRTTRGPVLDLTRLPAGQPKARTGPALKEPRRAVQASRSFGSSNNSTSNYTNGYSVSNWPPIDRAVRAPPPAEHALRPPYARRTERMSSRLPSRTYNDGMSAHEGTGSYVDTRRIDLTLIRSRLERAFTEDAMQDRRPSTPNDSVPATASELAIGGAGENWVYEMLKQEVGIDESVWTSAARASYGIEPFDGHEAFFSDFTITEPEMSARFCDWLLEKVCVAAAAEWIDCQKTFHIEVKTTTGGPDESFDMSTNQSNLARDWHYSTEDELIIFRVFEIGSNKPGFRVFVDPVQLRKEKVLDFEPKAGYRVTPN